MNQASTKTNDDPGQESSDRAPSADELREVYDRTDGNIAATARHFGLSSSWTGDLLVAHGIHERQEVSLAYRLEHDLDEEDVNGEAAL